MTMPSSSGPACPHAGGGVSTVVEDESDAEVELVDDVEVEVGTVLDEDAVAKAGVALVDEDEVEARSSVAMTIGGICFFKRDTWTTS
jgi:hypothetical protein